jgi:hypothetical protein
MIPSIFAGLCNGAISTQASISFKILSFIITESEKFSQPCTTLCQTASISPMLFMIAVSHSVSNLNASFKASLWFLIGFS